MKKFLLIILLGLSFGCENNEVQKSQKDYSAIVNNLDLTHQNAFKAALSSDRKNVSSTTLKYLKENYYTSDIDLTSIIYKQNPSGRVNDTSLDLSFLTVEQELIARPFLEQVMSLDELTNINKIIFLFEKQISYSLLNEEQKYQLFSMSSLIKQGVQMIKDAESGILVARSAGRVAGKIDVKSALRAGVEGLLVGAIGGAYAGATAGTVVFPVIGTVTGAVGCAVVSGAIGFTTGVIGSIASQLFWD